MNKQAGFSLVEIMIALLIGLFLMGGILQMFSASQQTYRMQSNLARLQENGRFALDFLARDIRTAGYWGCMTSSTGDISGTEGGNLNVPDSITIKGGFAFIPIGTLIPTGACGSPVNPVNPPYSCGAANCDTNPTSTITYSISKPATSATSPNPKVTLYRYTNNIPNPLLVEGIENMKILYGVHSDIVPDGAANYYVSANNVANMEKVVSVRISLLVVTLDDYLTPQPVMYTYNGVPTMPIDHNIRRVFNTTIAIRNRLP